MRLMLAIMLAATSALPGTVVAQNSTDQKGQPRVQSSEAPTRGLSINRLPSDDQCRQLLARAKAVPQLQASRDYGYCSKRLENNGK